MFIKKTKLIKKHGNIYNVDRNIYLQLYEEYKNTRKKKQHIENQGKECKKNMQEETIDFLKYLPAD